MKRDYNREMEEAISAFGETKPKLLLHACCAPCSSSVLERIAPHFDITVCYYNPNIYPESEYVRRGEEFARLLSAEGLDKTVRLIIPDYDENEFLSVTDGVENEPEGGMRCPRCFTLRLEKSAQTAKDGGFDYFATTLTVSPHKNAEIINAIGESLSAQYGVRWLPSDFKKKNGYLRSIELCRRYGIYRQDYCGCRFAMREE